MGVAVSREVRRVPLDFAYPLGETWAGYLMPDALGERPCESCDGTGYSATARYLRDRWYGDAPFSPDETGSTWLTTDTPAVRERAARNVRYPPATGWPMDAAQKEYREARRLRDLWNGMWCHHLHQDDVDALIAADRLWDFTRTWTAGIGWEDIEPKPTVTAEQVNLWSLRGFGHDSINADVVVRAACERQGRAVECDQCGGHGSFESYPGQRADADAWEPTDPPTGDGWQLWQTVSEGGPVSPVFATPELLADWIIDSGTPQDGSNTPRSLLIAWVRDCGKSAGSGVTVPGRGIVSGVQWAAEALRPHPR